MASRQSYGQFLIRRLWATQPVTSRRYHDKYHSSMKGEVTIDLDGRAAQEQGTVDWIMTFPHHSVASAFSRVVELGPERCVFSFVLTLPPVPLEQWEGALEQQSKILAEELHTLKRLVEHHA